MIIYVIRANCNRHLGIANGYHPMDRGFDWYVGLPYSDDMGCGAKPTAVMAPMNNEPIITL